MQTIFYHAVKCRPLRSSNTCNKEIKRSSVLKRLYFFRKESFVVGKNRLKWRNFHAAISDNGLKSLPSYYDQKGSKQQTNK